MDPVRLRFAPSPTGMLHIGGARTALFNWAWARGREGAFVLRIEDTDLQRSTKEFERAILDGLRWLGIDWDEGPDVGGAYGPYRQTERFERYAATAERLRQGGWAYRCFCSTARLEELREAQSRAGVTPAYDGRCRELAPDEAEGRVTAGEPAVLRFRVPRGETAFDDRIRGRVTFQNTEVDDWVMVRANGSPTYNFVVVCDDVDMRITHVMRGEEHLTNTPKQVLLYRALELEPPVFAHLPLMLGTDGKKLSKRTGDTSLQDYRDKGYPPEAVLNFLCLQGWALDDKTEIFSAADLIARFAPEDVGKRGAIFDPEKFLWMAGEYVRAEPLARFAERAAPYVVAAGLADARTLEQGRAWFEELLSMVKERVRLYSEVPSHVAWYFGDDADFVWNPAAERGARKHADRAKTLADFAGWLRARFEAGAPRDELRAGARAWVAERGLALPALFQPLRCVLTGAAGGPDLFDVLGLLGPERSLARIERGIERLS